jgi:Putative Flp pilus-assembly TadE/G-like
MTVRLKHRQRAQITPLALYAALVLVGALSLVVDAGVFFVTQRQLQTAVDAAALAAVWYHPVCDYLGSSDCQVVPPAPAPSLPAPPPGWPACDRANKFADCVAYAVLQENLGYTGALCRNLAPNPDGHTDIVSVTINGQPVSMNYYIMTVDCDAPYWFARVFPSIPATAHIRAFARATIGFPTPTGVAPAYSGPPPTPAIVSRLVS